MSDHPAPRADCLHPYHSGCEMTGLAEYLEGTDQLEGDADPAAVYTEALRKTGDNCGLMGTWHAGTQRTAADFGFDGPDLATRTIEMLERYAEDLRSRDKPFFSARHFFGPHLPYVLPDEYFDLVDPAAIALPPSVAETFEGKPPEQRNSSAHWTYDTIDEETSRKLIAAYGGYVALIDAQIGR